MKNLLLFLSVVAVVFLGFRLMKRLDRFLETADISEDETRDSH